jgi:hypothetical protein
MIKLNANTLKIGERYSVILTGDLLPSNYQGTLQGYYFSKWAQHENCLFLFLKLKGARKDKVQRIVLTPSDTVIITKGWDYKQCWRKEVITENENATMSRLHRLTVNDFEPSKVVLYKEYGQEFETLKSEDDFEAFADYTTGYCCNNDIRYFNAETNEGYINYIKTLLIERCYNVESLFKAIKENGYGVLENCLKSAIQYNW